MDWCLQLFSDILSNCRNKSFYQFQLVKDFQWKSFNTGELTIALSPGPLGLTRGLELIFWDTQGENDPFNSSRSCGHVKCNVLFFKLPQADTIDGRFFSLAPCSEAFILKVKVLRKTMQKLKSYQVSSGWILSKMENKV